MFPSLNGGPTPVSNRLHRCKPEAPVHVFWLHLLQCIFDVLDDNLTVSCEFSTRNTGEDGCLPHFPCEQFYDIIIRYVDLPPVAISEVAAAVVDRGDHNDFGKMTYAMAYSQSVHLARLDLDEVVVHGLFIGGKVARPVSVQSYRSDEGLHSVYNEEFKKISLIETPSMTELVASLVDLIAWCQSVVRSGQRIKQAYDANPRAHFRVIKVTTLPPNPPSSQATHNSNKPNTEPKAAVLGVALAERLAADEQVVRLSKIFTGHHTVVLRGTLGKRDVAVVAKTDSDGAELEVLSHLSGCPFVASPLASLNTASAGYALVLPLLDMQGPDRAKQCATDLLRALVHTHALGILHRDIKPENIGYDRLDNHWKLFDWDLATMRGPAVPVSNPENPSGTTGFIAPELFSPGAVYSTSSDVWSLGKALQVKFTQTDDVRDAVGLMLCDSPSSRPGATQLLALLAQGYPNPPKLQTTLVHACRCASSMVCESLSGTGH